MICSTVKNCHPQYVCLFCVTCLTDFSFALTGVALLPFVDEKRLLGALSHVYPDLTELESKFVVVEQSC